MQGNQLKETASQLQPTQTAAGFSDYTYVEIHLILSTLPIKDWPKLWIFYQFTSLVQLI
jgi:hypothetical protein